MAKIVSGVGTSHGPLLILPGADWTARADFDRKHIHDFRGEKYPFDALVKLRNAHGEHFEDEIGVALREERFQRCQTALDALGDFIREVAPDALVVIGDDQEEWFDSDVQPAFTVFCGDAILNTAYKPEEHAHKHFSVQMVESRRHTPEDTYYPVVQDLSRHIIQNLIASDFDVTSSEGVPKGGDGKPKGIGHAFSFIYRRILKDKPIPLVPVLLNTFYPPNQPTARRCFAIGQAIGRAIKSWDRDKRIMVVASGGLSHFVIDEAWDRRILEAMRTKDYETLLREPENVYQSGTSETKNWIVALGALSESELDMELIDYVPCYRSEAGTGNAMGFAVWR